MSFRIKEIEAPLWWRVNQSEDVGCRHASINDSNTSPSTHFKFYFQRPWGSELSFKNMIKRQATERAEGLRGYLSGAAINPHLLFIYMFGCMCAFVHLFTSCTFCERDGTLHEYLTMWGICLSDVSLRNVLVIRCSFKKLWLWREGGVSGT